MITPTQIQTLADEIQNRYEAHVASSMRVDPTDAEDHTEGMAHISISIDIEEATAVLCRLMEKVGEDHSLSLEDFIVFATTCFHRCLGFPMEQSEALAKQIISEV